MLARWRNSSAWASIVLGVAACSNSEAENPSSGVGGAGNLGVASTSAASSSTPASTSGPLAPPQPYPPAASNTAMGGAPNVPEPMPTTDDTAPAPTAVEPTTEMTDAPAATEEATEPESAPSQEAGAPVSSVADASVAPPVAEAAAPADLSAVMEVPLTQLTSVRQEHSVVALNGEIYMIGGYSPQATDSVEIYNPETQIWRTGTPFPEVMNHGNAASIGGAIYVAGYYINGTMSTTTTQVYAYDPTSEEWTPRTPMPDGTERAASCMAVDGDVLYVIAGASEGMSVDLSSRYDTLADEWEALPPLPERREHCVAGVINGVVYVAGGRADGITGIQDSTWALDLQAMEWKEKAPMPTPRGGLAGGALGGYLFVFGGEGNPDNPDGVFPNADAYEPGSDTWHPLPDLEAPRHGFGAAVLGDCIYLAGGATRQGGGADDVSSAYCLQ